MRGLLVSDLQHVPWDDPSMVAELEDVDRRVAVVVRPMLQAMSTPWAPAAMALHGNSNAEDSGGA